MLQFVLGIDKIKLESNYSLSYFDNVFMLYSKGTIQGCKFSSCTNARKSQSRETERIHVELGDY